MTTSNSKGYTGESGTKPAVPDHELLCQIGSGSYGEVWMARSITGAFRAVKIVHQQSFDSSRPYEREFEGISYFEPLSRGDSGLVDILQVGRNPENTSFYYVMELADDANSPAVDGVPRELSPGAYSPLTLETLLRREGGRLPAHRCVEMAITLARGLAYLHKAHLVHRDIKPSNIIFVRGVPKLADVGLVARAADRRTFVGTEGFIPPEGPGSPAADIYALGKCLYEAAMGRDRQEFPSPPTELNELPDRRELLELNEVITKACDPEPEHRYQDGGEMLKELELLAQGRSVRQFRKTRRKLVWTGWSLLAGLALLAVLFGWKLWSKQVDSRVTEASGYHLKVREVQLPFTEKSCLGFGQFDSDAEPEILLASSSGSLAVMSLDGHVLRSLSLGGRYPGLSLELFQDADRDGVDEIFGTMADSGKWVGLILGFGGAEINRFVFEDDLVNLPAKTEHQSFLRTYGLYPQPGGHGEAIYAWMHAAPSKPRELIAADWNSHAELWRYPVSGGAANLVFHDLDQDGEKEILFATQASHNGHTNSLGRNDATVYLMALRRNGKEIFCQPFAPHFCHTGLQVAEVGGKDVILAMSSRDLIVRAVTGWKEPGFARVARLEPTGEIAASWEGTNHLYDVAWGALTPQSQTNLYATDADGCLNVFDPASLSLIERIQITKPVADWVKLLLVGIADLDGDGFQEIVLVSQQQDFVSGNSLGKLEEKLNVQRSTDIKVIVLDHAFKTAAEFRLVQFSKQDRYVTARIVQNQRLGSPEIAVIDDRGYFLRLVKR